MFRLRVATVFFVGFVLAGLLLLISSQTRAIELDPNVEIDVRGMRLEMFPCSKCHNLIGKSEGRKEAAHRNVHVRHGEINKNCLNCHNGDNMDTLHLLNSKNALPFEKSYQICGQCHGNILNEWNLGIHGQQTGSWNGKKLRQTCSACHNPHQPKFKDMKPLPAPQHPHERRARR